MSAKHQGVGAAATWGPLSVGGLALPMVPREDYLLLSAPVPCFWHYAEQQLLISVLTFNEVALKTSKFHFILGFFLICEMIYRVDFLV